MILMTPMPWPSKKYGLKRFREPEELIAVVDAVDIVAPHHSIMISVLAIRKGKHVFVEKPLVENMDRAHHLVKLVKEANIKLQVGHVERFNPAFLAPGRRAVESYVYRSPPPGTVQSKGTEVSVILD
jgi:hypothetical protein